MNELVATWGAPGEFVDINSTESLMTVAVMRRAMQSFQGGSRDAAKEIRAKSILHAYLAEMGADDDRFLGPEWVLTVNGIVANMCRDYLVETMLEEFKRRTSGAYA